MPGRMTRAKAAEVADKLHIDADALLEIPDENGGIVYEKAVVASGTDRLPLGEMTPNSSAERKKPRKIRGAKGSAKNMKDTTPESPSETPEVAVDDNALLVAGDDNDIVEEMINDKCEDILAAQVEDTAENSAAPVAMQRAAKSVPDGTAAVEDGQPSTSMIKPTGERSIREDSPDSPPALHAPASPFPAAVPKVIESLRMGTPGKRSASNKENIEPCTFQSPTNAAQRRLVTGYDQLEAAAVGTMSPPVTPAERTEQQTAPAGSASAHRRQSSRPEDHISALDELDEAVEKVNEALTSEAAVATDKRAKVGDEKVQAGKPNVKAKRVPEVRPTRASQARISLAQGGKVDFAQSVAARRASSMRQSGAPRFSNSLSKPRTARADLEAKRTSSTAAASSTDIATTREKTETVIPHSKPRPVSLSFPTPPPPPKSRKALTTSTFQLPGEAVAAKLRAAREARTKKEAEAPEKATFKARPAPSAASKTTPTVRHTAASKARESIAGSSHAIAPTAHRRASSVASASVVAKRASVMGRLSTTSKAPSGPAQVAARPSTAMGTSRLSPIATGPTNAASAPTAVTDGPQRVPSGKGTMRGKEVFNRAAFAQANVVKGKREKEEAARKARTEAAERSRQASRAWAEKQKLKKMGLKPEPKAVPQPESTEVVEDNLEAKKLNVLEQVE